MGMAILYRFRPHAVDLRIAEVNRRDEETPRGMKEGPKRFSRLKIMFLTSSAFVNFALFVVKKVCLV
jgi:hypothetical protein